MSTFFAVLIFVWLVILVVGLVKPSLMKASRKKIALIFGSLAAICFVLTGITAPDRPEPIATAESVPETKIDSTPTPIQAEEQKPVAETPPATPTVTPVQPAQEDQTVKVAAQKELDELIALAKKANLVTSYEFSDRASVVYADNVWYTQTVQFKKDFLAKVGTLKKQITGYQNFVVRDAYSNEKVAEITSFSGSLEVYK